MLNSVQFLLRPGSGGSAMFTWLILLALIGFVVHVDSRLRKLERRLEEGGAVDAYRASAPVIDFPEPERATEPPVALHAHDLPVEPVETHWQERAPTPVEELELDGEAE